MFAKVDADLRNNHKSRKSERIGHCLVTGGSQLTVKVGTKTTPSCCGLFPETIRPRLKKKQAEVSYLPLNLCYLGSDGVKYLSQHLIMTIRPPNFIRHHLQKQLVVAAARAESQLECDD